MTSCPNCGFSLENPNAPYCPNCGRPLSAPPENTPPGANPYAQPYGQQTTPGMYPPPPSYGQPAPPSYGQPAPPSYGQPTPPSYGQPAPPSYGQSYGYPPQGPNYGPSAMPNFGQPTGPSYGQPAPPSMPMYAPQGTPSPWGGPPPQKSSGAGRVIAIVGGVVIAVVVLVAALSFLLLRSGPSTQASTSTSTSTSTTAASTATPSDTTVLNDPLTSSTSGWANDSHCFFASDGYHIKSGYFCFAPTNALTDATISVQVKQKSGSNLVPYGIAFRVSENNNDNSHYEFDIDSHGKWVVFKCPNGGACTKVIDYTSNAAIKTGLNTSNTLQVVTKGSQFTFFVNGTQVGQTSDTTYTSGAAALAVGDDTNMECVFTNILITTPNS